MREIQSAYFTFNPRLMFQAGNELSPSHRPSGASSEEHHVPDEGFICPSCMTGFASAEELQAHYEARHGSEAGLEDLRAEVAKVRSTLNQEKLHSTELKREVDRLSGAVHNRVSHEGVSKKTLEEEHSMYREQVLALQEGKALCESLISTEDLIRCCHAALSMSLSVAQEVISLRNELSNCQISGHEKEKLLEKTAQLAAENVELKAAVDELAAQRQILQEQVNERYYEDTSGIFAVLAECRDCGCLSLQIISGRRLSPATRAGQCAEDDGSVDLGQR